MSRVTLSGALPGGEHDGLTTRVESFMDDEHARIAQIGVVLFSTQKRVEDLDRDEDWCVVRMRHVELADDEQTAKELADILGRLFGKRTGQMALPYTAGDVVPVEQKSGRKVVAGEVEPGDGDE